MLKRNRVHRFTSLHAYFGATVYVSAEHLRDIAHVLHVNLAVGTNDRTLITSALLGAKRVVIVDILVSVGVVLAAINLYGVTSGIRTGIKEVFNSSVEPNAGVNSNVELALYKA